MKTVEGTLVAKPKRIKIEKAFPVSILFIFFDTVKISNFLETFLTLLMIQLKEIQTFSHH